MLTKNLLKTRIYRERIFPAFLEQDHPQAAALADSMIAVFTKAAGQTAEELENSLNRRLGVQTHLPFYLGFKKLLTDRCEGGVEHNEESTQERRWQAILTAQAVRSEQFFNSKEEYQEAVKVATGCPNIDSALYNDLPQFLPIVAFDPIDSLGLLHRYNCALIQGVILQSRQVRVTLKDVGTVQKRALFRTLRFFQLIVDDVVQDGADLSFSLTGPLSIFDSSLSYGMKIANFFPYILQMPQWSLITDTPMKGKNCTLQVAAKDLEIKSHYKDLSGYIPQEFTDFMVQYNARDSVWKAAVGGDFIHIGRQADCFPDIVFTHEENGRKVYVELFHKWHRGELIRRLKALETHPAPHLLIGVSGVLAKADELKEIVAKFAEKHENLFVFRDFPAPSAVDKLLK